jgi:AcrR family transcriptional regulator
MARISKPKSPPHALVVKIKSTVDDPQLVERRRTQITAAAIHVFSKMGYHPATIRDVANRADVSVGLIYQYVADKEDLLFLALLEILEAYKRRIPMVLEGLDDPMARFGAAVRTYCVTHGESVSATVLAYRETASLSKPRRNVIKQMEMDTNELIAKCIRDCVSNGSFRDNTDVEFLCYHVIMFSHAWALKAWNFGERMDVDTYVDRGLAYMLEGVMTAKGARQFRELNLGNGVAKAKASSTGSLNGVVANGLANGLTSGIASGVAAA